MRIVGIDYAMGTAAICIMDTEDPNFLEWQYFTGTKKYQGQFLNGHALGVPSPKNESDITRFRLNASMTLGFIEGHLNNSGIDIAIEGYAFSAKGQRAIQIGENGAILKTRLEENDYPYEVVNPSSLKLFATGIGNAKKIQMFSAFTALEDYDLLGEYKLSKPDKPVEDLVDAYFLAKYKKEKILGSSTDHD